MKKPGQYDEAKRAIAAKRLLARRLMGEPTPARPIGEGGMGMGKWLSQSSRIRIDGIEQTGKGRLKYAVISVGGAKSDFYNPLASIAKWLKEESDPSRVPQPIRRVDPCEVHAASPGSSGNEHQFIRVRTGFVRMKRIAGNFRRAWQATANRADGFFFMFADKVLFQAFHAGRWINLRVPPEGIDVTALLRKSAT